MEDFFVVHPVCCLVKRFIYIIISFIKFYILFLLLPYFMWSLFWYPAKLNRNIAISQTQRIMLETGKYCCCVYILPSCLWVLEFNFILKKTLCLDYYTEMKSIHFVYLYKKQKQKLLTLSYTMVFNWAPLKIQNYFFPYPSYTILDA